MKPRDEHIAAAKAWFADTPFLSFHPGVPPNLPLKIATEDQIDSLARLLDTVYEDGYSEGSFDEQGWDT